MGYDIGTAQLLGANLMAYITSERSAALPLSQAMEFVDASKTRAGKFMIAQAKYNGLWKCRDAGLSMLLNYFHEQTGIPITFNRDEVPLSSAKLFDLPLIYMTGHLAFKFTDEERANLARYLRQGGILFAESCCGREDFTKAFRHEIDRVLPGARLERIQGNHVIFRNCFKDEQ